MRFKTLIFDLDGTLVNSKADLTKASNQLRNYYGLKSLSEDEVISYVGNGLQFLVNQLIKPKNENESHIALDKYKEFYSKCLTDNTVAYEGIKETLEVLKDLQMAILSNKSQEYTQEIIKFLGLSHYFVEIWGSDNISGFKKPDKRVVLALMDKLKANACETVIIGDGINDIKVAKDANIYSIAVLYGFTSKTILEDLNPDYFAQKPFNIIEIIKEN